MDLLDLNSSLVGGFLRLLFVPIVRLRIYSSLSSSYWSSFSPFSALSRLSSFLIAWWMARLSLLRRRVWSAYSVFGGRNGRMDGLAMGSIRQSSQKVVLVYRIVAPHFWQFICFCFLPWGGVSLGYVVLTVLGLEGVKSFLSGAFQALFALFGTWLGLFFIHWLVQVVFVEFGP